ncbi:MAG: hypothetical protein KDA80_21645 [Planctomycetaceae bacterium]|nr:hypothetical protein [Planctomycetaceae bacterium]
MSTTSALSDAHELLTIQECSEYSWLSVPQLRRLVKERRIPYLQPGGPGGKLLFRRDALFEANQAVRTPQSTSPELPTSGRKPKWTKN